MPSACAVVITSTHCVDGDPAARDDVADRLVEDLRRRAGQGAEARGLELAQVLADRQPGAHRAVQHFLRRERVDVQLRQRRRDRAREIDVVAAVELGRQPRLDAHLGSAEVPRFLGAPHDLLDRQEVALLLAVVATEGAEGAVLDADVREVDVAIHDVGDDVADLPLPQLVGDQGQRVEVAPVGAGERDAVLDRHLVAVEGPGEDRAKIARDPVERTEQATSDASVHGIP